MSTVASVVPLPHPAKNKAMIAVAPANDGRCRVQWFDSLPIDRPVCGATAVTFECDCRGWRTIGRPVRSDLNGSWSVPSWMAPAIVLSDSL